MTGGDHMRDMLCYLAFVTCVPLSACDGEAGDTPIKDAAGTGAATTGSGGAGGDRSSSASQSSAEASSSSGTGGSHAAGFESGDRLRARYILGADGSKQLTGFYDSEKGVDCVYLPLLASGELRCVPASKVPYFDVINSSTRFADANCTVIAPPVSGCTNEPTPAYLSEGGSCGVHRTWAVAGQTTAYQKVGLNCNATGAMVWNVSQVASSEWVLGTEMTE